MEEFERNIHRGDDFRFDMSELSLSPSLLRRIQAVGIAGFEATERTGPSYRKEVVEPFLAIHERQHISGYERLSDFLRLKWRVDDVEADAIRSGLISLRWLVKRQCNRAVDELLMQAFDFVELFQNFFWLEYESQPTEAKLGLTFDIETVSGRLQSVSNRWVRFLMGCIVVEFVSGDLMNAAANERDLITRILQENASLVASWTGRNPGVPIRPTTAT